MSKQEICHKHKGSLRSPSFAKANETGGFA